MIILSLSDGLGKKSTELNIIQFFGKKKKNIICCDVKNVLFTYSITYFQHCNEISMLLLQN